MLEINQKISTQDLLSAIRQVAELSEKKLSIIFKTWNPAKGTPVFTVRGQYTARGWTEWTQGFLFGSAILHFDLTNTKQFLELGKKWTISSMASHLSHIGVHDHGFNNISTYGNLLRLIHEKRLAQNDWEQSFYELALKVSGAVQAARWTQLDSNSGYIYSFNGPHSLFADTIRSLRVLAVSHQLGHCLMGEKDQPINLLKRLIQHAETTARYNVFFGKSRDRWDVAGRVSHESIFNLNDRSYRCPSSQQGYSPFSTWTRGQAWILCGYTELLEFLAILPEKEFKKIGYKKSIVLSRFLEVAKAVADFYITYTPTDGIPYWDTAAPGLASIPNYLDKPADPFNNYEPVDSSAAIISAQGLLRLGRHLIRIKSAKQGTLYYQAGLTIAQNIFREPYLSLDRKHQGLILHSIYHRPNDWDHVPPGSRIPRGESSLWGDYHARELALLIYRQAQAKPYYKFFL